ncbi:MAG: class I SAM-dependent methyltransferase [Pseudonocardiaceae bacterium]
MSQDPWSALADHFVDEASSSVKGKVRTYVLHQQLLDHLSPPPAAILDVGGGAAHQALPLARAGYEVTVLDSSPAMLSRAEQRLGSESAAVRARVQLVHGSGEDASHATSGESFSAVLCHGVLMYLDQPQTLVGSLCECLAPGGVLSLMALNAKTLAVLPALQRQWADALAAFDARSERGVLGVPTRADTVEELSELLRSRDIEPEAWYGVWLFADLMNLTPATAEEASQIAAVELQASRQDPYRQLSRVFHLIGRSKTTSATVNQH